MNGSQHTALGQSILKSNAFTYFYSENEWEGSFMSVRESEDEWYILRKGLKQKEFMYLANIPLSFASSAQHLPPRE